MPNQDSPKMSPSGAATILAYGLGLSPTVWAYRLANWRKPDRQAVIPHLTTDSGAPVYDVEVLKAFIDEQLVKRELTAESAHVQPRAGAFPMFDHTERPHVRVTFATGSVTQSVFAVDTAAARRLAAALVKSADMVDEHAPIPSEEAAA